MANRLDNQLAAATRRAFRDLPSPDRGAELLVDAAKVTEGELKDVELALLNPPAKPDWLSTFVSAFSAAYFALKTYAEADDAHPLTNSSAVAIAVAGMACALLIARAIKAQFATHPFHEKALETVRRLATESSAKKAQAAKG